MRPSDPRKWRFYPTSNQRDVITNVDHGTREIVFRLGSLAFRGTVDTCMQMAVIDRGDRVRGAAIAPVWP